MILADLKITLRAMRRQPIHAGISMLGLAVGMASFILIALFVREELRFDRFHEHADRIVRVTSHYEDETGTRSFARSYPAIGPAITNEFPEVVSAVRLQRWKAPVRYEDRQFNEQEMFMVDPSFFEVFTFPLVHGDPHVVFRSAGSVAITESTARRYFGDADPLGKTLVMADSVFLEVAGVVSDPPAYSHIQFSILMPMSIVRDRWAAAGGDLDATWTAGTFYTYLLMSSQASRVGLDDRLAEFVEGHVGDQTATGVHYSLQLQPLTDIHLKSDLRQEMGPNGSESTVIVFLFIAGLVLIISAVNFINLATAQASKRTREIGVRKSLGAARGDLTRQFLLEAVLMSSVALLIGLIAVDRLLPWFNSLAGTSIALADEVGVWSLLGLALLALMVGLLAGVYPALIQSSLGASIALRDGTVQTSRSNGYRVRRGLVAFQFFLSVSIMTCTVIAWQQTSYMSGRELGFDSRVLVVPYYWEGSVNERLETLKGELSDLSVVRNVTASGDVPGRMFTSMSYWIEGMDQDEVGGINALIVDADFAETYGLEVVQGRDLSLDQSASLGESFILNEAAVKEMGMSNVDVVGKQFEMNTRGPVIGVVRDFHFEGLQSSIEPLAMTVWPDWFGYLSVRLESGREGEALGRIEEVWTSLFPTRPFEYFFLDEDFDTQYLAERRFSEVFAVFAILAIIISSLGLFGLASFAAERRTKEIGIRKVFGASISRLVALLNREFALLVLLGGLVSIPATWMLMDRWLQTFAYRIEPGPIPFILSLSLVGLIGLTTVSYHAIRAAIADPIKSLRHE